ncbi:MAG: NAD(P)/FAD-dependent oxidoreductase [Clostridia bacterium]|nr:NAD(P)/FAD-dependent oxidoreductase [Clostridia bacterium]
MIRINNLLLPISYGDEDIKSAVKKKLKIGDYDILSIEVIKDSIDAHRRTEVYRCVSVCAKLRGEGRFLTLPDVDKYEKYEYEYPCVSRLKKRPVVVGSGPAGLFCALILSRCGAEPIVIERGLDVDSRKKEVYRFFSGGTLNTECNIQFGEGGAGTFSDGKLNTGTKDSRQRMVLSEFIRFGAPEEIAVNGKPHIGTDLLSGIIKNMRNEIIKNGGEFRFNCKLEDIYIESGAIKGIKTSLGDIDTDSLILAIGHSARDTFEMLFSHNLLMERKSFSMGVRIEHPQSLINEALYHKFKDKLPPADYKAAVHLKDGRGVYTFCMCPGGTVVAASSEENTVVTNGMSNFLRDGENANSALLVSILPTDFNDNDIFSGMKLQRSLEKSAYFMGGANYNAPVQTVKDFLSGQKSVSLGNVTPTYPVGVTPSELGKLFPSFITNSLREAIPMFDRKIKGFALDDAVLTAVESRSSSPVRIIRNEAYQSSVRGIYPCGEGAGYAGGIMSAAVDGIKVAEAVLK